MTERERERSEESAQRTAHLFPLNAIWEQKKRMHTRDAANNCDVNHVMTSRPLFFLHASDMSIATTTPLNLEQ